MPICRTNKHAGGDQEQLCERHVYGIDVFSHFPVQVVLVFIVASHAGASNSPFHRRLNSPVIKKVQCGTQTLDVSVNFKTLLKQLVAELQGPESPETWSNSWAYVNILQMFTPMPLDVLGGMTDGSWFNRSDVVVQGIDLSLLERWYDIYNKSAPDGRRVRPSHFHPKCTTDVRRFPPVMCHADCNTPCPCCTLDPARRHKVYFLELVCGQSGTNWVLTSRIMQMVAPDTCRCQ